MLKISMRNWGVEMLNIANYVDIISSDEGIIINFVMIMRLKIALGIM